ncbi:MAG: hypothetical protein ACLR0U_18065 [Enterocloster clostridioformis]
MKFKQALEPAAKEAMNMERVGIALVWEKAWVTESIFADLSSYGRGDGIGPNNEGPSKDSKE